MNKIALEKFRCFGSRQEARLAPLTLLMGDNSTGKTSFMAMIHALCKVVKSRGGQNSIFKPQYNLGSFEEIAHHRGARGGRAENFEGELTLDSCNYRITFGKRGSAPEIVKEKLFNETCSIEVGKSEICFKTPNGTWKLEEDDRPPFPSSDFSFMMQLIPYSMHSIYEGKFPGKIVPTSKDTPPLAAEDRNKLGPLCEQAFTRPKEPVSFAPVRSKPNRTYDTASAELDAEGSYIPMHLADLYFSNKKAWHEIKEKLEDFGRASGLFDEISIKSFGEKSAAPFQIQVRKFGPKSKGPFRNLIDVGYGNSQVLPIVTELFRRCGRQEEPSVFLLQQPEVHLHPSAQAALGTLFCNIASENDQLVVETHSDYLLDRVRMDVRDGKGKLNHKDVSVLFFERDGLEVRIHSIEIDKMGNILNAPPGYGKFFLKEIDRSLWG